MILVRSGIVLLLGASGLMAGGTGPFSGHAPVPASDQWMYTNAYSPGGSEYAPVFTSLPDALPGDDNRMSQFVIKFNTVAAGIPLGLGASNYDPSKVVLTCVVVSGDSFVYDPTLDALNTHGASGPADPDPGRAIEVHGTGFRAPFTAASFLETSPYGSAAGVRNAYALGYTPEGVARDVSNNFTGGFDSIPWATAKIYVNVGTRLEPQWEEMTPGELVPRYARVVFELNLASPGVADYVRTSLNQGFMWLTVSSLYGTTREASSGYPSFFTKEDFEQTLTHDVAATLDVEYSLPLRVASFTRDTEAGTARIAWNASPGFSYRIEKSDDFTTDIWQEVGTRTTATAAELNWSGPSPSPRSFFRVSRTSSQP